MNSIIGGGVRDSLLFKPTAKDKVFVRMVRANLPNLVGNLATPKPASDGDRPFIEFQSFPSNMFEAWEDGQLLEWWGDRYNN